MKEIVSLLILLGLLFAQDALSQQKNKHDKQNIATEYLDKNFGTYDALQKKIWEMPELGFIETESSKQLQEHLEANGFTVEAGVAGMPTAFVATYGSGSPVIGILAQNHDLHLA